MIPALFATSALCLATGVALQQSPLNSVLFVALNSWALHLPAAWWAGLTNLGSTLAAAALLLVLAPWSLQPLRLALLAALPTTLVVQGLKHLTPYPRPAAVLDPAFFTVIDKTLKSGAFPSGHTATAVVVAGAWIAALWPVVRRQPAAAWVGIGSAGILALAVALSRIAVGAHWPSDLLGGLGAGLAGLAFALSWAPSLPWVSSPAGVRRALLLAICATVALPYDPGLYPSGMAAVWGLMLLAAAGAGMAWRNAPVASWGAQR